METSEIVEIAKKLAACEYILQTSDSQEEKDMAEKYIIQLAFTIPDLETLSKIDELTVAILEKKVVL